MPKPSPPDPAARPPFPGRNFDSSRPDPAPWFQEVVDRFSPGAAGDDWATEAIAPFVEKSLTDVLLALVDKALWMPHLVQAHMTFGDESLEPVVRSASETVS